MTKGPAYYAKGDIMMESFRMKQIAGKPASMDNGVRLGVGLGKAVMIRRE